MPKLHVLQVTMVSAAIALTAFACSGGAEVAPAPSADGGLNGEVDAFSAQDAADVPLVKVERVRCGSKEPAMCTNSCADGERCYSDVSCHGGLPENPCNHGKGGSRGDNTCHRLCSSTSECPTGQRCLSRRAFFFCTDVAYQEGICCGLGECPDDD